MAIPKILELLKSFLPLILLFASHTSCQPTDTLTSNSSIKDPDFILSSGNIFKLGFFTPQNSTNRYLGIFYTFSEETVVWVANRNKPLKDSSGIVTISRDGNLVLRNGQNETLWSTNTTMSPLDTTMARILDSGNLVLRGVSSGSVIWESFMHPSNIFLPTMKEMNDTGTGRNMFLSSWKTSSDPGVGNFTNGIEFRKIPEVFTWKNGQPYWRSGPWNGKTLLGLPTDLAALATNGIVMNKDDSGIMYATVVPENNFIRIILDPSGGIFKSYWDGNTKTWIGALSQPSHECDIYGKCGPFGSCNRQDSPICSCLRGFEPKDKVEWEKGNWSGGCVRRKGLECNGVNNTSRDGFLTLRFMKLPDFAEQFTPQQEDECRTKCLANCSCIAYAYDANIGCMFWSGSLIDVQQFPGVGADLHIRLASSELEHKEDRKLIVIILSISAFIFVTICIIIGWWWRMKPREERANGDDSIHATHTHPSDLHSITVLNEFDKLTSEELPSFTLEMLANATNQFHDDNLLGKGGFGHVYKGNFVNGKEIAVKRLSVASGQGKTEFMNEVMVISKLQHKNLIRLIGYCVERNEKILVYEYMPNKSLDSCLFDPNLSPQRILDWRKRFHIIEGVGRGLLYLHKDSRVKIIHRDLKPSNVLLDENYSPKISDFGMARIFGGDQVHGDTSRVVGTYGYMAPEYAAEGRFSEKSDVYSFGVLMLEIISGKKSIHYYNQGLSFSFLGYAWKLWTGGNGLELVDQNLVTSSNDIKQIMRCIHIALLCVQEFSEERPDIQTVLSMLSGEIVSLAMPEEPMFADKWDHFQSTQSSSKIGQSVNEHTLTVLDGR